jgi:hypothetical protein
MVHPPITGKISKKRGNINMKTSKKKEILSFTYKNHWYRVLLPRTARPVVDQTVHGAQEQCRER